MALPITTEVELTGIDGNMLTFRVQATQAGRPIMTGEHTRAVVELAKPEMVASDEQAPPYWRAIAVDVPDDFEIPPPPEEIARPTVPSACMTEFLYWLTTSSASALSVARVRGSE